MFKSEYDLKLAEDAAKRFRMLCEYTFNITEDDGEDDIVSPELENPKEGNGMGTGNDMPDMSSGNTQGEGMPNMNGMDMNNEMPNMEQGNNEGGQGAPGFNPSVGEGVDDMSQIDGEEIQPEDEVIDVDDLTNSQEKTEEKVEDIHVTMEKGFDKLLDVVEKLNKMIDNSTANMEHIKQEIERRNPTPIEKLNMRAANDSYPFNVSPSDYWKEKEATSNYRIGGENEPDSEQYIITQGDIDDMTDFNRISKELEYSENSQNLMNIFGLR